MQHLERLLKHRAGLRLQSFCFGLFWSHCGEATAVRTWSKTLYLHVYTPRLSILLFNIILLCNNIFSLKCNFLMFRHVKTLRVQVGHDPHLVLRSHRNQAAHSREGRPNERSHGAKYARLGQVGCGAGGGGGTLSGIWTHFTSVFQTISLLVSFCVSSLCA